MTTGSDPEALPEGWEWLSREQVADLDDVSERTVTERISSGYYESKKEGRSRLIKYKRKATGTDSGSNAGSPPEAIRKLPEQLPESAGIDTGTLNKIMAQVLEVSQRNELLSRELLDSNKALNEKSTQLANLNNERMSYNTSLQRASDDRAEVKRLHEEMKALREEKAKSEAEKELIKEQAAKAEAEKEALAAENAKLKEKKPWWKELLK